MIIGKSPHVILGQEMLKPRDGSGKDEGELTGGKRLIEQLKKRHGYFADVIVADALYLNAPFINTLKENGLEGVIRLKDERRMIFQDAGASLCPIRTIGEQIYESMRAHGKIVNAEAKEHALELLTKLHFKEPERI